MLFANFHTSQKVNTLHEVRIWRQRATIAKEPKHKGKTQSIRRVWMALEFFLFGGHTWLSLGVTPGAARSNMGCQGLNPSQPHARQKYYHACPWNFCSLLDKCSHCCSPSLGQRKAVRNFLSISQASVFFFK